MTKEMEFFIYLMEMYAENKGISTTVIVNKLKNLDLIEMIYNMYERYHQEAIENAYDDIDELIKEKEENQKKE